MTRILHNVNRPDLNSSPNPATKVHELEKTAPRLSKIVPTKAGEGNRTLTTSLEGWSSTIELHPQIFSNMAETGFEPVKA